MNLAFVAAAIAIVLTAAFFFLKVTHLLTWSWLWIVSPLWICLALAAVTGVVLVLMVLNAAMRGENFFQ